MPEYTTEGLSGVIAIDCSTTPPLVIVKVTAGDVIPLRLAVILLVPTVTDVATPSLPAVLLIVATAVVPETHVTLLVIVWVVPSEYVPVAINDSTLPKEITGYAGVIVIDCKIALVTVRVMAVAVIPLKLALIFVVPVANVVAKPLLPAVLLIVAVAGVSELHVTLLVIFWVLLSEYVPVAINCCVLPKASDSLPGVIAIDCNVALDTLSITIGEVIPLILAVILLAPDATDVATPLLPAALLILVFTAGIGENAPLIRQKICSYLQWQGVTLDEQSNIDNATIISSQDSTILTSVIPTDEEHMIAKHTYILTASTHI